MPDPRDFILGFDPGGKGNFGWSICEVVGGNLQSRVETGLANDAWDAINKIEKAIKAISDNSTVLAAGIDAPLFWSRTGNRRADTVLRKALKDIQFPTPSGTVQAINSLRGACVVQGPLLVRHLSDRWDPSISESHPKALDHLLHRAERPEHDMVDMVDRLTAGLADHQRDATLSAVSAWAAIHHKNLRGWQNLYNLECCPIRPFDIPVSYWMPVS